VNFIDSLRATLELRLAFWVIVLDDFEAYYYEIINLSQKRELMLVTRWQAPIVPAKAQVLMMFEMEGYPPYEEVFPPGTIIQDHRHPFDEVRMVVSGQLILDVAGNKLLLRAGDKIVIPSNTRHSKKVEGTEPCVCICAHKTF
jgi:hypothetical protein